jgi:tetratricopeptide (TPR) repeat protein
MIVVGTVVLLAGCSGDKAKMLQQLELLEQQNRSGEAMLNDSLAESLVNYFDRHGDANERMRSRYILGRTYYCLDELPRALEMYNEAADCADTTSADCDFAKLSRVYAQSAEIYYNQVQPRTQLENLRRAQWYAQKGKDTLMSIECFARQANAYEFLNEWDSVVYVTDMASDMFNRIDRKDRSVQVLYNELLALIHLDNYDKAGKIFYMYEKSSGFFDETNNIDKRYDIYYYIKGLYYLGVNKVDSAESLFRKELSQATDLNNRIAGCKGLQAVYSRKGIVDSIAKYANLGYVLNDSAYSLSEMQNIQKFQASYNYNHHKLLAEQSEKKAQQSLNLLIVIIALVAIISILVYFWFKSYQAKRKAEILQYRKDLEKLETRRDCHYS